VTRDVPGANDAEDSDESISSTAPRDRRGGMRGKRNVVKLRKGSIMRKLHEGSVMRQEIVRGKHNVAGNCAREAQCGRKRKLGEGSATWQKLREGASGKHNVAKLHDREGSVMWQEIVQEKHKIEIVVRHE
jgi:hypothetical protein